MSTRTVKQCLELLMDLMRLQDPPVDAAFAEPVTEQELAEAERCLGLSFPDDLKEMLRYGNGQRTRPNGNWYFYDCDQLVPSIAYRSLGYQEAAPELGTAAGWLESASHIVGITNLFNEHLREGTLAEPFRCFGPATLHGDYVVFLHTENSDTLAMDLKPSPGGTSGQVVSIDTSGNTLCVVSKSLNGFLELLVDGFTAGRFTREPDSVWLENGL